MHTQQILCKLSKNSVKLFAVLKNKAMFKLWQTLYCIEKLVNIDYTSKMVFKRSQKSQLKMSVSRFLLFGEHNRSIIVENCEHSLGL